MQNEKLWNALQSLTFDDVFVDALMQENRWERDFAQQAIGEYRRFLYLTQVSDSPVTPSVVIDRVWHKHMTYTRDYWDGLCKTVFERPLHHEPGRTPTDAVRHAEQYRHTRALYAACFDQTPPDAFWAATEPSDKPKRLVLLIVSAIAILAGLATGRLDVVLGSLLAVVVVWKMSGMPLFTMTSRSNSSGSGGCATCGSSCGGGGCGGD